MKKIKILYIFSIVLLFFGCLTPKEEPVVKETPVIDEEPVEPETVEEPVIEPVEPTDTDEYVATEEEYEETFIQVEDMIAQLNDIISSGNYDSWTPYLSEQYIEKYGNKEYLTDLSNNSVLKEYKIKLKNLKDYFLYVVVPSRSNVKVDEIKFLTEDTIIAYMYKEEKKIVVYQLQRKDISWIITD